MFLTVKQRHQATTIICKHYRKKRLDNAIIDAEIINLRRKAKKGILDDSQMHLSSQLSTGQNPIDVF